MSAIAPAGPGGVRLRHRNLRGGMLTVEHRSYPYREPFSCPVCKKVHVVKTYHLSVDSEGYTFLSAEMLQRLYALGALHGFTMVGDGGEFEYVDDVRKPPPITLSLGATPAVFNLVRHRIGDAEADDEAPAYEPPAKVPMPTVHGGATVDVSASGLVVVRRRDTRGGSA